MAIRSSVSTEDAKARIFAQDVPLVVQRSAFLIFRHCCNSNDPDTGKKHTPEKALDKVIEWMREQKIRQARSYRVLEPQQLELVQMLVDGLSQGQIGAKLDINLRNLQRRFERIRDQLNVKTVHQVVAICVAYGWVDIEHLDSKK